MKPSGSAMMKSHNAEAESPDRERAKPEEMFARKLETCHRNIEQLDKSLWLDYCYEIRDEILKGQKAGFLDSPLVKNDEKIMAREILEAPEYFCSKNLTGTSCEYYSFEANLAKLEEHGTSDTPVLSVLLRLYPRGSRSAELLLSTLLSWQKQTEGEFEILAYGENPREEYSCFPTLARKDRRLHPQVYTGLKDALAHRKGKIVLLQEAGDEVRRDAAERIRILMEETGSDMLCFNGFSRHHKKDEIRPEDYVRRHYLGELPGYLQTCQRGTRYLVSEVTAGVRAYSAGLSEKAAAAARERELGEALFSLLALTLQKTAYVSDERLAFRFLRPADCPSRYREEYLPAFAALKEMLPEMEGAGDPDVFLQDLTNLVICESTALLKNAHWGEQKLLIRSLKDSGLPGESQMNFPESYYYSNDDKMRLEGFLSAEESAAAVFEWAQETGFRTLTPRRETGSPVVSVIIPVYNTAEYLKECLESVCRDTDLPIEIICVNDGSTDDSLALLLEAAAGDERIIVLDKKNGGQSNARNAGVTIARGEYLYFMDSDDRLAQGALKKLSGRMKEDQLQMLYFDGVVFGNGEPDEIAQKMRMDNYLRRYDYPGVCDGITFLTETLCNDEYRVAPCMQMAERRFYCENRLSFFSGIFYEDNLYNLEALLKAQRVGYERGCYYERRIAGESVTMQKTRFAHVYGYYRCYKEVFSILSKSDYDDELKSILLVLLEQLRNSAIFKYTGCAVDERQKYVALPADEYYDFYRLVVLPGEEQIRHNEIMRDLRESNARLQHAFAEKSEMNAKLHQAYEEKSEINAKLQEAYKEKSEINARLQQAYAEKSEINARLQQAYEEKSEINARLQQTYEEKSEINARLQQTYEEKSEINARLQQTYGEKSEINARLRQTFAEKSSLNARLQQTYKEKSSLKAKLEQQKAETDALREELEEIKESKAWKLITKNREIRGKMTFWK